MATFDLEGRTALVTGGFSGLGLHFARVLAAHGAKLALVGRRIDLGRAVAQEIGSAVARPSEVRAYQADVTDSASVGRASPASTSPTTIGTVSSMSTSRACSRSPRRRRVP